MQQVLKMIRLMNLVNNFLSQSGFCTLYFGSKYKKAVTLPHIAQRRHAFLGKIKEISKTKKLAPRKKVALYLLHQGLRHRSTR